MPGKLNFFLGADETAVKSAVAAFARKLCGNPPEENPDLEIIRGDSDTEKCMSLLDALINTLATPPFLSPQKIVWMRHFNKFDDAQAEKVPAKKNTRLEILADMFKKGIPDGITLIFDGFSPDRKRVFYKACKEIGSQPGNTFSWFDKIDVKDKLFESKIIAIANEYSAEYGKKIDDSAATWLAKSCGPDLALLKNEILKLSCYADSKPVITVNDCREICAPSQETAAWEFSSALAERKLTSALELIPQILATIEQNSGSASSRPEIMILATVTGEFKRMLAIKCGGLKLGLPNGGYGQFKTALEAALEKNTDSIFAGMHPFRAFKLWENCKKFQDNEFADIFSALFDANKAMVTGTVPPRKILENLALKIANK